MAVYDPHEDDLCEECSGRDVHRMIEDEDEEMPAGGAFSDPARVYRPCPQTKGGRFDLMQRRTS